MHGFFVFFFHGGNSFIFKTCRDAKLPNGAITHSPFCRSAMCVCVCCVITVRFWIKYTPWKNQGPSSASHTHKAWWWCQFTFQVHRLCCYTIILALPWSGVHTVLRGLCRLAQAITAFGLPWHVLTCSTNTKCSLSLLTVHWLQADTLWLLHRLCAVITVCTKAGPKCLSWKCLFFVMDTVRTCAIGGQGWSGPKCIAVLYLHIAEACLKIWFSLTAPIGWCGRLSVHESSYMDPCWSWSFLMVTRHPAIYTLIPCTIQKYVLLRCG